MDYKLSNTIKYRLVFDICLIFSVMYMPWWISIIVIIVGAIFIENYWEAIIVGFIIDSVFSTKVYWLGDIKYFYTIFGILMWFLNRFLYKRVIIKYLR